MYLEEKTTTLFSAPATTPAMQPQANGSTADNAGVFTHIVKIDKKGDIVHE